MRSAALPSSAVLQGEDVVGDVRQLLPRKDKVGHFPVRRAQCDDKAVRVIPGTSAIAAKVGAAGFGEVRPRSTA